MTAFAQGQARDEQAVRAAYVFNLMKFVEWPGARGDIVIAVVGDPAMGGLMKSMLDGRQVEGGRIRIVASPPEGVEEGCSALYVTDSGGEATRRALERLRGHPVLTIGETASFAEQGGVVALVKSGDHIQIDVNLEAAQRAGVKISSRVLNLAHIVAQAQEAGTR